MIPAIRPVLFGRTALMEHVVQAFRHEDIVLLAGIPGVGKSAIARTYAHDLRRGGALVCWVRLAGVEDVEVARQRICEGLLHIIKEQATSSEDAREEILHDSVEDLLAHTGQPVSLILDGAEGVLELLAATWGSWWQDRHDPATLRLLVTTRKDPHHLHARLIFVEPLQTSTQGGAEDPCSPAARLFIHCASKRGWNLDAHDPLSQQSIQRIVTRLSGIPTAIEIAASRGKLMGLAGLESYLAQDLSILEERLFDLSSRQRNVEHMLRQSWEQLHDAERATLAMCCAFHVPFRIETLARLAGLTLPEALTRAESLVGQGLLLATHQKTMVVFHVLEIMRRFIQATPDYEALTQDTLTMARRLSLDQLHEVMEAQDEAALDPSMLDACVSLASEVNSEEAASLLSVVFERGASLSAMQRAHDLFNARQREEDAAWLDPHLITLNRRFARLYTPARERHEEEDDVSLSALDPFSLAPADPHGPGLHHVDLLMRSSQVEAAERSLQAITRAWGGARAGVRAQQLELLTMEALLRRQNFQQARQLARQLYRQVRLDPRSPLWETFVAASMLLELLGALDQPILHAQRLRMTWRACGLDVSNAAWWPALKPGGDLHAMLSLLEWVKATPPAMPRGEPSHGEDFERRERLIALLTLLLQAREQEKRPETHSFYQLTSAWRAAQSSAMPWFDLLLVEIINASLRHEKLHSIAAQLHSSELRVTIDMQKNRFRVGDASWVSFGHRPKARLLIERMIQRDEEGDFLSVQSNDLIEHIWPDEKMRYDSALARLYNLVANLRRLGLNDVLAHEDGGYHFAETCTIQVIPAED